ncbi:MAG: hypothetical protein AABW45_00305, partial [Nanoarchaeota archaeon]
MSLKKLYNNTKKEHLFIFLAILTALILFQFFGNFGYTGLTVRDTCYDLGYSCCYPGAGQGNNYFSLDNTCSQGDGCWDYCSSNLLTTKATFKDSFNKYFSDFKEAIGKFFGRGTVGEELIPLCKCNFDSECSEGYYCDDRAGLRTPLECDIDYSNPDSPVEGLCKELSDDQCITNDDCPSNAFCNSDNLCEFKCNPNTCVDGNTRCNNGRPETCDPSDPLCLNNQCVKPKSYTI